MAIQTVRVQLNGIWTNLTKNASTGKWEGSVTAPGATSYNLAGGYYPVTVEATNDAGTKTTATVADLASLKLVVKERIAPVIAITSPGAGARVTNAQAPIVFTVRDETGGSGVKLSTLRLTVDGTAYTSADMTCNAVTGGYDCTFTPGGLADGEHTVTVSVEDNDGNAATQATRTYIIDTVPPVLNVTSPPEFLITAQAACTVQGTTNDATSSPVTVAITLGDVDVGAVTVADNGSFSKAITLAEGDNTIVVTATDAAGKVSTVILSARLDTTEPQINTVTLTPNPVDAGATMAISIEVV